MAAVWKGRRGIGGEKTCLLHGGGAWRRVENKKPYHKVLLQRAGLFEVGRYLGRLFSKTIVFRREQIVEVLKFPSLKKKAESVRVRKANKMHPLGAESVRVRKANKMHPLGGAPFRRQ